MEEIEKDCVNIWETPPTVKTPIVLMEYNAAVYGINNFNTPCLMETIKTIALHASQMDFKYIDENFEAFMNSGIADYILDKEI